MLFIVIISRRSYLLFPALWLAVVYYLLPFSAYLSVSAIYTFIFTVYIMQSALYLSSMRKYAYLWRNQTPLF